MPRLKINGEQDKRSETSTKNVAKARITLAKYLEKGKAIRDSSSDEELVINYRPKARAIPKRTKHTKPEPPSSESESESEPEPEPEPSPSVSVPAPKPSRCHSTEIDDLRAQLLELRGQFGDVQTRSQPPAPTLKERDPVIHGLRQQLIASALRF